MKLLISLIALVLMYFSKTEAFSVTLDSTHDMECFLIDGGVGNTLTGTFEVIQGDAKSLTVSVTGPKGLLHYESKVADGIEGGKDLTEGSFEFDADIAGRFKMCLSRNDNARGDIIVAFNFRLLLNDDQDYEYAGLNAELAELQEGLDLLRDHLSYMSQREDVHKNALSRIDVKVLCWSILEAMILIGMGVWQIGYISSFFEIKRRM